MRPQTRVQRLRQELEAKPEVAYSGQTMAKIRMLSYREDEPTNIIGSYSFRSGKYPGDIDAMNTVEDLHVQGEWIQAYDTRRGRRGLVASFVTRLQEIVKAVVEAKTTFYLEVKAGYDWKVLEQLSPIGSMLEGRFVPASDLRAKIAFARGRGFITDEEAAKMIGMLERGTPFGNASIRLGAQEYDYITNTLRKGYVLRWGPEEIAAGVKLKGVGQGTALADAVYTPGRPPSLVKIDVISRVNGRFMEISNFFLLRVELLPYQRGGAEEEYRYITNVPNIEDVTFDVEKMLFSPMWYNPYKAIKRMFVFARAKFMKERDTQFVGFLEAALPFINGDEAVLYQVKGELETLVKLIKDFPSSVFKEAGGVQPIWAEIRNQLSEMKGRLAGTNLPESEVIRLSEALDKAIEAKDLSPPILEAIEKILKARVKEAAIRWLTQQGLAPPTPALTPFLPDPDYTEMKLENDGPLDPLLSTLHDRTYDWSLSGAPVAAGDFNIQAGGCELCQNPEADARARLAQRIMAQV